MEPYKEREETKRWWPLARQITIGSVCFLGAVSAASVLSDTHVYKYMNASAVLNLTIGKTEAKFQPVPKSSRTTVSGIEIEQAVVRAANQQQLHPALLLAVMKAESSFNPLVVSKAGAVGLMQLVPETAMRHGVLNPYDTDENIAGGAKHLRYLLDRFHGNTRRALAAYNAGERKVDRYKRIPPYKETRQYVQQVLSYYRDYKREGWMSQPQQKNAEPYVVERF